MLISTKKKIYVYKKKIQFPTSHLEAENPFGLVLTLGDCYLSCIRQ